MIGYFGRLLGFDHTQSIDSFELSFAASWASDHLWLLFSICLVVAGGVVVFYRRFENCKSQATRIVLSTLRAVLVCMLVLTLAAPLVHSSATVLRLPLVFVVIDDSESMSLDEASASDPAPITRVERLRQLFSEEGDDLVRRLEQDAQCRVQAFRLGNDTNATLNKLSLNSIAAELRADGAATPLLEALSSLPTQASSDRASAMIVLSDFVDTSNADSREKQLAELAAIGIPVHAAGVGATTLVDVSIDLIADKQVKRGEPTNVAIAVKQSGMDSESAIVTLHSRALEYLTETADSAEQLVGETTLTFGEATNACEFTYTPDSAGTVELIATVTSFDREQRVDNNTAARQLNVIADYLRVSYVEYEPNWEWRHIKDVFGRDKLVGRDGFRTFLASAASDARANNELFNTSLEQSRSEFLVNDVVMLGDVPRELLTADFCELTEEFVGRFGGGLVVIAGPRFGPNQLADTPLAKMLPVFLAADATLRDPSEFELATTNEALLYPFMRLADLEAEDTVAWNNLGKLPWYQPVAGVHQQADVLAEHPVDLCDDDETKQPLIAIRPYGKGQVVYLAFNEMWRLRKQYGDRYYQRFWSQLIYRLGMSHAIGIEKRFVAKFDREKYSVGDEASFTVDAYDEDFQPIGSDQQMNGALSRKLATSNDGTPSDSSEATRNISLPMTRPGHFAATFPLTEPGNYAFALTDPVSGRTMERRCFVANASVERRQIVRDVDLQRRIAEATGGRTYEVSQVDKLIRDLEVEPTYEQEHRQFALWNTPAWFLLVVGLMLSEWTLRKLAFLR